MLSGRTGATKDTLNNLREVPEFVLQVVSEEMAEKMNLCSGEFAAEVDEFSVAGLAPAASRKVSVPRVAEARAVMECRLQEIITVGSGPGSGSLVLGEVVLFEVEDSLLVRGEVAVEELAPIGRLAGAEYCRLTDRFSMQRPEPESLGVRPRLAPEER
jgi:flavin reductase (DIM6/NTAB) family NADH-FMN oxidoreductase RutF